MKVILTEKIIEKEFALSGSEQNPDLTNPPDDAPDMPVQIMEAGLPPLLPQAPPPLMSFLLHN